MNQDTQSRPHVKFWYSEGIGRVRAVASPGGDAFTIEQAEELRDELSEAIEQARADRAVEEARP